MGNTKQKKSRKNTLLRVGAVAGVCAITAGVIGAGTMARYSSQFGADGFEDDGNGGTRGARAAQFHFVGQYAKDGDLFSDATGNLSLFSSMYKSSDGKGTTTDGDDVTVKADQQVVAPGTNGSLSLKMDTTNAVTENKRCYAETDTIVKLDVKQLVSGVYEDASTDSKIPIVYTVNGKNYTVKGSNLEKGHTYVFSNRGTSTTTPTQSTVTIDGYLDDLVNNNAYYYKAKDKFYQLDGTAPTYTAADKAHIVDTDDGQAGIQGVATLTLNLDWKWNYQNLGDITTYITGKTDAGKTVAEAIADFNAESAATKATYLTEASAHANDAFDTALGEAAFAKANGGTDTTGDIQLSVRVDATQVD